MGSQRKQTTGDTGRRQAIISPASWRFRRRQATSSDGRIASYKRGVTGSNPVAPTRSEGLGFPVPLAGSQAEGEGPGWLSRGGRFGQAPRAWRRCYLLRGGQEPVHRRGLGRFQFGWEAAAPEVSGKTKQEVQDKLRVLQGSSTPGSSLRWDTRSKRRWRTGSSMGCRAGRRGRSSCTGTAKALSAEQAEKLVKAAADELPDGGGGARGPRPLHAYVVLLLTTGLRPEEAQALCWESRRSRRVMVAVWRSDRARS